MVPYIVIVLFKVVVVSVVVIIAMVMEMTTRPKEIHDTVKVRPL